MSSRSSGDDLAGRVPASERWGRTKALFLQALDLPDEERSAFLLTACGPDEDLRRNVESLLQSDRVAGAFCETPAAALLGDAFLDVPRPRLRDGDRLGPYEIAAFIGAGGMGEVYRARHTQLRRDVAIKIVGAGLEDAAARQRLVREARHASRLCHPNICTIHEIGDVDDVPFIVMEHVDGRPLDALLAEHLPSRVEALAYGIEIADALEHAHERGIVHRDLKASNIAINSAGRAIVLDFGLAKRLPGAGPASMESREATHPGLAGTVDYMAPEVLQGHAADARSDIWALGVLLYELATGGLPFAGRTPFETSSAILGEPPKPMPRRVPLALRRTIARCLAKDPADRYQRAADVRDALDAIRRRGALAAAGALLASSWKRAVALAAAAVVVGLVAIAPQLVPRQESAPFGAGTTTLALLPVVNATGDPAAEYYAQGLGDTLTAQLGALQDLRVVSPASTRRLVLAQRSVPDIGRALGAHAIVEGTLRQFSGAIRLDVRLIDASHGGVLRSDTYERPAAEVLALQADVVRALALGVQISLRPDAQRRLAAVRAVDPAVYEAYLQGRHHWNQRSPASLEAAIDAFTRAVERDPTYAPAHAAIADCYNLLATQMVGVGSPREYRPLAAAAAIAALQIDPDSAEAHAALGYVRHYEWQWVEAERQLRRAIELNPSYALARIWYANLLMSRGRMAEAVEEVTIARDLDPFSLIVNTNVGWILHFAGRHEDAIERLEWTLDLDANYVQARQRLSEALADSGRLDAAVEEAQRMVAIARRSPASLTGLAHTYARAGREADARALVDEVTQPGAGYVAPGSLAVVHAVLGDRELALDWLERAFDEGSNQIAYLGAQPAFRALADHPRFRALLARAGLPSS